MISKLWSKLSLSLFNNIAGRHCHWCKHMISEDGQVYCQNKQSQFNDGKRIRTWDGAECAILCSYFELDEYYTKDENYNKTFKQGEEDEEK